MTRTGSRSRSWLLGSVAIVIGAAVVLPSVDAATDTATPGSQGIDTSLPATDSQVVVRGRDAFSGLAITINQTTKLANQAVSITWTGGQPTLTSPGTFTGNFLQIMQCWGDDDGSKPANPGPPPEQCVQGAIASTTTPPSNIFPDPYAISRVLGLVGTPGLDMTTGKLDTRSGFLWKPFRAVNGTQVDFQVDPTFVQNTTGGSSWLNPYFNSVTTNEIAGGRTGVNGTGSELFEVHTGLESSGLGCGQKVQPVAGGGTKVPQCWIVIVPRGDSTVENLGTPFETTDSGKPVSTSPLSPAAWKNRIAVPISFTPVENTCALGVDERRIVGSELVQPAVASWQPALCSEGDLPPFSFAPVSDAAARQQLARSLAGGPGMVMVSRPLSASDVDPKSPAVYAPVSVSGITIGFTIERNPKFGVPDAELQLAGVRVADLRLTPRLVAKLLTQSYKQQTAISGPAPASYTFVTNNPLSVVTDPDFLQFNPEFALLQASDARTLGGLQLPSAGSDAAVELWRWILADPEAAAWLRGTPDAWGMRVNPMYSTDAQLNPTGAAFGTPLPSTYPKADPYCFQGEPRGPNNSIVPPPLCSTDWMPYARNYAETAKVARSAFDGARIIENPSALSSSQVWIRSTPQYVGTRSMLSLTDTPSAARFGLQMARLSRAGDNGADRQFIAPDSAGLRAGVAAMTPAADTGILESAPEAIAPGAYPLTLVTYAAIKPLSLDTTTRSQYAAFIDYAVGAGQVSGVDVGQLPGGYATLPDALRNNARAAAAQVRSMQPVTDPSPTTGTTIVSSFPGAGTGSGGAGSIASGSRPTRPSSSATTTTTTTLIADAVPTDEPAGSTTTTTAPAAVATDSTTDSTTPAAVTPTSDPPGGRFAVAAVGVAALGSALGALEITKRARRPLATAAAAVGSAVAIEGDPA